MHMQLHHNGFELQSFDFSCLKHGPTTFLFRIGRNAVLRQLRQPPPVTQQGLHYYRDRLELRSSPTCCGQNGRSIVRLELCLVLNQQVTQPRCHAGLMPNRRVPHKRGADCKAMMVVTLGCCSLMGVEGELAVVDPSSKEAGTSSLQDSQDVRPCSSHCH